MHLTLGSHDGHIVLFSEIGIFVMDQSVWFGEAWLVKGTEGLSHLNVLFGRLLGHFIHFSIYYVLWLHVHCVIVVFENLTTSLDCLILRFLARSLYIILIWAWNSNILYLSTLNLFLRVLLIEGILGAEFPLIQLSLRVKNLAFHCLNFWFDWVAWFLYSSMIS